MSRAKNHQTSENQPQRRQSFGRGYQTPETYRSNDRRPGARSNSWSNRGGYEAHGVGGYDHHYFEPPARPANYDAEREFLPRGYERENNDYWWQDYPRESDAWNRAGELRDSQASSERHDSYYSGAGRYPTPSVAHGAGGYYDQRRYGQSPYERQGYTNQRGRVEYGHGAQSRQEPNGQLGERRYEPNQQGGHFGPAPRSGRGPRNYTRSDDRIREDICDRLVESDIDASEVEVQVSKGEITLTGTVPDRQAKHNTEYVAESVPGVKHVNNQLRVKIAESTTDEQRSKQERAFTPIRDPNPGTRP